LLDGDFAWASVYEKSFIEHIALLVLAIDKQALLSEAVKTDDPQQTVLDEFDKETLEEWVGGFGGLFEKKHLIGLVVSLQKSILSIMIYQKSLSALVEEVRQGNVDALFDAVRIDQTITACPTIADRIARADLLGEKRFF
jgi:hypothetical protein